MSNNLRTRNGMPFNFVNGLKVRGMDIESLIPGIEGIPEAGSKYQFAGDGTNKSFTLPVSPYNKDAVDVYVKQLYVHPDDYTLVGDTVTLVEAPPAVVVGETYNVVIKVSLTTLNGYVNANRVSFEGENLDDILEKGKPLANYSNLRAYAGASTQVRITDPGIAGFFYYDAADTTSVDNGGTIIVGPGGKRWKRVYDGAVNVKSFGAVGDGVTDDTIPVQNALNYMKATGITLALEPNKTYLVSQVLISLAGANTRSNFRIEGNGATLKGSTSSPAFRIYRCQGLNIHGLRVQKHATATYASDLDSFWFANFTECEFGETRLHADNNWGVYWNEFNGCSHQSLHFDLTDNPINQNVWKGGTVGRITKTNVGHPIHKEAYNNVFIGVDVLGAIDWRDASSSFHDPLIFRDCNMEYTGINYGYIIAEGGRSNPVDAANTRFFPSDDFRSEFNQQYSGAGWVTGWHPRSSTNLIRGGAVQAISPDLSIVGVGSDWFAPYADASSPTGNGYCYRGYFSGTASPRIKLRMSPEFLAEAKRAGYVSFCFEVYNVNGGFLIGNTSGTIPSGDAYFTGYDIGSNQWKKVFCQVPVGSSAVDVSLYIGGGSVTGFDVRIANVACYIGKIAFPYTPAPNEPHPLRGRTFTKTLVANGVAQNTFSLTIPTANTSGSVKIKAFCNTGDSVSIYTGLLCYARHNTGGQIAANIVEQGKAQSTYGGGTAGTIGAMAASATGSTVTVATTIANYTGTPNRAVVYEVEFMDANETLTVL